MLLEYPFTFPYINFQAFYSFSIWNSLAHIYSTIFASLNVIGKNHISTPHAYLHKTTPICPPRSVGTSCCVTIVLLGSNTIDQYYFFGTLRNHLWACLMGCTLVNNVPRICTISLLQRERNIDDLVIMFHIIDHGIITSNTNLSKRFHFGKILIDALR